MSNSEEPMDKSEEKVTSRPIRSAIDLQRMKLEKLMKNPSKPAFIPESSREKKFPDAPEFVRNVMGSSAGAGSGEFHVYRHIRRREYARDIYLQQSKERTRLDEEFKSKLDENKRICEEKASKKRKKRQKRKEAQRKARKNKTNKQEQSSDSESNSEEEETKTNDENVISKDNKTKEDGEEWSQQNTGIRNEKLKLLKDRLESASV